MTKATITPIAIALFGLTLILLFQISSLLLLINLNTLSHRGSGRDRLTIFTSADKDPSDKAPKAGDGRRDA